MKMTHTKIIFVGPHGSGKTRTVNAIKANPDCSRQYVSPFEFGYIYDCGSMASQQTLSNCDYCVLFGNDAAYAEGVLQHSPNVTVKHFVGMKDFRNWLTQL